jgi:Calcineurin-like phosphoesterase
MDGVNDAKAAEQRSDRAGPDPTVDSGWKPELIGTELPIAKISDNIFALGGFQLAFPVVAAALGAGCIFCGGMLAGSLMTTISTLTHWDDTPWWFFVLSIIFCLWTIGLVLASLEKLPFFLGTFVIVPYLIATYIKGTLVDRVIAMLGERYYASYREIGVRLLCCATFMACIYAVLSCFPALPGPIRFRDANSDIFLEAMQGLVVPRDNDDLLFSLSGRANRRQMGGVSEAFPRAEGKETLEPGSSVSTWHLSADSSQTLRSPAPNFDDLLARARARILQSSFNATRPGWKEFTYLFRLILVCGFVAIFVVQAGDQVYRIGGVFKRRLQHKPSMLQSVLPAGSGAVFTLAHISDLHIVDSDESKLLEGGHASPNESFRALCNELKNWAPKLDVVLATGDLTDSGMAHEWHNLFASMSPELLKKLLIIPGNHDLNITDKSDPLRGETLGFKGRNIRLIRFMAALDRVQGERVLVADASGDVVSLRAHLAPVRAGLLKFATSAEDVPGLAPFEIWNSIFPMVYIHESAKVCIYLLDSNDVGHSLIDNAFGVVSTAQLDRLALLMQRFDSYNCIFALHHHVALPPDVSSRAHMPRFGERFMVLRNATALVSLLESRKNGLVFHGHRHVGYQGRLGNLEINAAPSSTLGDEITGRGTGFFVYWVGFHENGGIATNQLSFVKATRAIMGSGWSSGAAVSGHVEEITSPSAREVADT